jgi:hypothetical protein
MRLEGQSKMGYYPTPDLQVKLIKTWLSGQNARLLDPCCGKGEALAEIAGALPGSQTYGIELSDTRAAAAAGILGHVLNTGFEYAVLTRGTFSAVLLNPPYDGETETGSGTRLEERFLAESTPLLTSGGVLVYIIPHARITETVARHLAGWYEDLRCYRLAGEDYAAFKQVVIFGRKGTYRNPSGQKVSELLAWAGAQVVLDWIEEDGADGKKESHPLLGSMGELPQGSGEYLVPAVPEKGERGQAFRFKFTPVSDEDFVRAADKAAMQLEASRSWLELAPPREPPVIAPAIAPLQGHIAMQVTAGLLGTNALQHQGKTLLLKGRTDKTSTVTNTHTGDTLAGVDVLEDEDERSGLTKVEIEEEFRTAIVTLTEDGELETFTEPSDVEAVLKTHLSGLVKIVEKRNAPLYDYNPEPWEWQLVSSLSQGKALPGMRPGLSDKQKHFVIAAGRTILRRKAVILNVEQGGGKTRQGIALAEYLYQRGKQKAKKDGYPVLIAAPGMVTSESANWSAEIPEVTPGARSVVVQITAKPTPKAAKISAWLKVQGIQFSEQEEAELAGRNARSVFQAIERFAERSNITLTDALKQALLVSLKQAERKPPARRKGAAAPHLLDGRIGGYLWLGLGDLRQDEDNAADIAAKRSLAGFVADYRASRLPERAFVILSYETAKLGPGRVPAFGRRLWSFPVDMDEESNAKQAWRWVPACPHCGQPVAEEYDETTGLPFLDKIVPIEKMEEWTALKRHFCAAPVKRRCWNAEKGEMEVVTVVCGSPLFENSSLRREAAAEYVKKKASRFFPLVLMDELHKCKGKGTGVGWALSVLAGSSRYTAGLTGTLFGGYSTSIFWLLHRISPEVRRQYAFNGEMKWAGDMGLIKKAFYVPDPSRITNDGAYTGTHFFETVDEKPGISPGIARYILPYTLFASLPDMGLPLPSYSEHIIRLDMMPEMQTQYTELDGSQDNPPTGLLAWALEEQKREDKTGKGAISVWWSTIFNRPNAMFRDEQIIFHRRLKGKGRFAVRRTELVTEADAISNGLLPKESWLVDTCRAQRLAGRKSLVFVRQTGERDIQERLAKLLQDAGLRVEILRPSIAPNKRIDWLKKHAGSMDVLLTNSKLVEVGLNLIMFPTAIFYEIEPSFYVLYQAMRRVWRPFAPLPVEIYFAVYRGTAEEMILDLMGEKMLSNQLLTGQEVGGALVPEDAGNILQVAVNRLLGGVKTKQANSIFAGQNTSTASPLGSPTAESPKVAPEQTLEVWLAQHAQERKRCNVRKGKPAPQAQMIMPI